MIKQRLRRTDPWAMSSQRTTIAHLREPLPASEYKRRRAYEGLMVFVTVMVAVVVVACTLATTVSSALGDVGRALTPGPAVAATDRELGTRPRQRGDRGERRDCCGDAE